MRFELSIYIIGKNPIGPVARSVNLSLNDTKIKIINSVIINFIEKSVKHKACEKKNINLTIRKNLWFHR